MESKSLFLGTNLTTKSSQTRFYIFTIIVAFIALFYNYGKMQMIDDEGIRALVAVEMMNSGEYLTPTLGGDLYLKKPPLFNWFIVGSYKLFGEVNEWSLRFPTICFLLIFCSTIFVWVKKNLNTEKAFYTTFFFMTCIRMLLFESLHGLIDIAFSWIIFMLFISIFEFGKREKYWLLFLSVYLFGTIGYFLKGLPSLVFIGFSLLGYFIWKRKFWTLFHPAHIVSFIGLFGVLFLYYFSYVQHNNIEFSTMLEVIFNESSRRTGTRFGLAATVQHFFVFPFWLSFHLLPWSIFIPLLFTKQGIQRIKTSPFLTFGFIIFMVNIWIYWISVEVHPRYILMLLPFAFMFISNEIVESTASLKRYISLPVQGFLYILPVVPIIPIIIGQTPQNVEFFIMTGLVFVLLCLISWNHYKNNIGMIPLLILTMLTIRIGFDAWVLPVREIEERAHIRKRNIQAFVESTPKEQTVYSFHPDSIPHGYYGRRIMSYDMMWYMSASLGYTFKFNHEVDKGDIYVMRPEYFDETKFHLKDSVKLFEPSNDFYFYIGEGK